MFQRDLLYINAKFKFNREEDELCNKFRIFKEYNQELQRKAVQPKNAIYSRVKDNNGVSLNIECFGAENNNDASKDDSIINNAKNTINNSDKSLRRKKIKRGKFKDVFQQLEMTNKLIFSKDKNDKGEKDKTYDNPDSNKSKYMLNSLVGLNKTTDKNKISCEDKFTIKSDMLNHFNINNNNKTNKNTINNNTKNNENLTNSIYNDSNIKAFMNISSFDHNQAANNDSTNRNLCAISELKSNNLSKNLENIHLNKNKEDLKINQNFAKIKEKFDLVGITDKNYLYMNALNIRKIIENSKNIFTGISYFDYCCPQLWIRKRIYREEKQRILKAFNNGRNYLSEKLDLFIYLENLNLLELISKFILNKHQRFYFNNNYMYTLNDEKTELKSSELINENEKFNQMIQYFEMIMDQDFNDISKTNKLILENIYNQ